MDVQEALESIRALLPDVVAVLDYAQALPAPVDPVVDDYLRGHVGVWRLEVAAAEDTGTVRQHQEDGVFVCPVGRAFVVIDGMGGQNSGIYATMAMQESLAASFPWPSTSDQRFPSADTCPMVEAFLRSNTAIRGLGEGNNRHRGAGAAAAGVFFEGHAMNVVHLGDCRVYRLRGGKLARLTEDHSLINEYERIRVQGKAGPTPEEAIPPLTDAQRKQYRNILPRGLGYQSEVEPGWSRHEASPGDLVLLCSDGVWQYLGEEAMEALLVAQEGQPVEAICGALMGAAIAAPSQDNLALILLRLPARG